MILSKEDLKAYIIADSKNYHACIVPKRLYGFLKYINYNLRWLNPISDQKAIWDYIKTMRKTEYYINTGSFLRRIYYLHRLRKLARITGFQIPPNVISEGLTIWHWGTIIINPNARIGKNLMLQPQVVIGWNEKTEEAPVIGDNVTIYGGSFIYGGVHVGNNVVIACNSFVNKDIPNNCMVAGNPATIIKYLEVNE